MDLQNFIFLFFSILHLQSAPCCSRIQQSSVSELPLYRSTALLNHRFFAPLLLLHLCIPQRKGRGRGEISPDSIVFQKLESGSVHPSFRSYSKKFKSLEGTTNSTLPVKSTQAISYKGIAVFFTESKQVSAPFC